MDFEEIILKAQQKAQKIASKVEKALKKDSTLDVGEVAARILRKFPERRNPEETTKQPLRLTYEMVQEICQKTGFKLSEGHYWFTEDYPKNPLIQISRLDLQKLESSPIYVLCIAYKNDILNGTRVVTDTVRQNLPYFDLPSHKWTLGLISQLTELSCSYILGFNNGFDGNAEPHPKCSSQVHLGYGDGLQLRQRCLSEGTIVTKVDAFASETDHGKLSELYRVGYYQKESTDGNIVKSN